jgi:threonine aldolase
MFGKEAALFCTSGTMTNQIAIQLHVGRGDEMICEQESHVYIYEGGGIGALAGASVRPVAGKQGKLSLQDIEGHVNDASNIHLPITRLISLENTANRGGGAFYRLDELQPIYQFARAKGLKMHLDGARVFNALIAGEIDAPLMGSFFDTLSVCFSKGLGAPVGSAILGSQDDIARARRIRKRMGGGWRQAGYLAAAALYALDHHIHRLEDDHRRAKIISECLAEHKDVEVVLPVETNIVVAQLKQEISVDAWLAQLKEHGVLALPFGHNRIRMITHLHISDADIDYLATCLNAL